MMEVRRSQEFARWLDHLADRRAKARIELRLLRAETGHLGDVRSVGEGVSEMRIDTGPGYRLYFVRRGDTLIILLCGGDKSTQERDIKSAKARAAAMGALR